MDSQQQITALQQELERVKRRLERQERRSRLSRLGWFTAVSLGLLVWAGGAFAQLVTFNAGQPALASEINANFTQLKTWLETKVGSVTQSGVSVASGGVSVASGGVSVTSGGVTVTAGGLDVQAGAVDLGPGTVNASQVIVSERIAQDTTSRRPGSRPRRRPWTRSSP